MTVYETDKSGDRAFDREFDREIEKYRAVLAESRSKGKKIDTIFLVVMPIFLTVFTIVVLLAAK